MREEAETSLGLPSRARELPVEVDSAVYRLRLLCAANARVFRLALSNGRPFRLIAGDAGLLGAGGDRAARSRHRRAGRRARRLFGSARRHARHAEVARLPRLRRHVGRRHGARIHPCETGWKDTVLLLPQEQVEVIMKFDRHRGLFLLHCHNLEHEDMGMMLNFLIE